MKNSLLFEFRRFSLLQILSLVFLAVFLLAYFLRVNEIQRAYSFHGYIATDWLINYSSGFIRRGLFGEFALWLNQYLDINPVKAVLATKYLLYATLCGSFFILCALKKIGPIELVLIFAPYSFMFDLNDPMGSGRKELFLLATFSCFALLELIAKPATHIFYKRWDFWFLCISFPIITLMHEGLFFFLQFFILFIYLQNTSSKPLLFLIPYGLTFCILLSLYFFFRGSVSDTAIICASLNPWSVNGSLGCEAIDILSKPPLKIHSGLYKSFIPLLLLTLVPLALYGIAALGRPKYRQFLLYSGLAFILSLPLFMLGIDWGRWIHTLGFLFLVILISIKNNHELTYKGSLWLLPLFIFTAFLYLFYWRIAHYVGGNKVFWWWTQDFLGYFNAFRLQ